MRFKSKRLDTVRINKKAVGSMDQTTLMTVAALGVAVCAGIYVLWGPDNWFRKKGNWP